MKTIREMFQHHSDAEVERLAAGPCRTMEQLFAKIEAGARKQRRERAPE